MACAKCSCLICQLKKFKIVVWLLSNWQIRQEHFAHAIGYLILYKRVSASNEINKFHFFRMSYLISVVRIGWKNIFIKISPESIQRFHALNGIAQNCKASNCIKFPFNIREWNVTGYVFLIF